MRRRRPSIPSDYGIATDQAGMLEWASVTDTLVRAGIYWISTIDRETTPHLIPIWGAWVGNAGYIEGGDTTRWARSLANNPALHLGVDHWGRQVMVRGVANKTELPAATRDAVADGYAAKYPYRPEGSTFWQILPSRVLAWDTSTLGSFASTPTEFVFEEAS